MSRLTEAEADRKIAEVRRTHASVDLLYTDLTTDELLAAKFLDASVPLDQGDAQRRSTSVLEAAEISARESKEEVLLHIQRGLESLAERNFLVVIERDDDNLITRVVTCGGRIISYMKTVGGPPAHLRDLVPNTTVAERIAWINKAKTAGLFATAVPSTDNAKVRLTPGPEALAQLPAVARIAAGYQ